jgi:hypothetical protein
MDNTFDITPFVFALTHTQAELEHAHPSWLYWCADCNEDGRVDNFDVGPFIYELTH